MGTVINTADGQQILLASRYEDMVDRIAESFRYDGGESHWDGRKLSAGFMLVTDVDGRQHLLNTSQITTVTAHVDQPRQRTAFGSVRSGRVVSAGF